MYIYRTLRPLLKTYTVKYKPSHPILLSQKNYLHTKSLSRTSSEKTIIFALSDVIHVFRFFIINCIHTKCHPNVFVDCLKAEKFSAFLLCGGSLFHIFGPRTLKLFLPNFNWLVFMTFKLRFYR